MVRRLRPLLSALALLGLAAGGLGSAPLAAQSRLVAEPVALDDLALDDLAPGGVAVPDRAPDGPGRSGDDRPADHRSGDGGAPGLRREVALGSNDATTGSGRFVAAQPSRHPDAAAAGPAPAAPPALGRAVAIPRGIAAFGPFRVLDGTRAALVDVTDERSPAAFQAMLARYPGIRTLELIECPGTEEDRANLRLGRMIRARGLATHVPAGGSVRSGGVELYLAGVRRQADPGAEFAVHAWADEEGRQPQDFPLSAPQNRAYLVYYRDMGMTPAEARAFYDMTNSVPNASALWLSAAQMAAWVRPG